MTNNQGRVNKIVHQKIKETTPITKKSSDERKSEIDYYTQLKRPKNEKMVVYYLKIVI